MEKNDTLSEPEIVIRSEYTEGLVSVIIPSYNRERLIGETLDSVYGQTHRPIEVIVVDDGSKDDTVRKAREWGERHSSSDDFSFSLREQTNKGACTARNLGLVHSTGEYIQFLDSDDIMAPSKIEMQIRCYSRVEADTVVFGSWRSFRETGTGYELFDISCPGPVEDPLSKWLMQSGGENWFVTPHSFLWRRDDIRRLGFWDESLSADQDGDYSMRFLVNGGKLRYCAGAWSYYRLYLNDQTSGSIRASFSKNSMDSRYRVIARIEDRLTTKGNLDRYRIPLADRYARLANRCALYYPDLAKLCLLRCKMIAPDGKIPVQLSYDFLSKILGLHAKQKIGSFIRRLMKKPYKGHIVENPCATVTSIEEVLRFDSSDR